MGPRRTPFQPAIALALSLPALAAAQSADYPLEEVHVTAQRRDQNFNDVGIAVTAISGEELQKLAYSQLVDIAGQTPNVQIKNVIGNSITNVTIRGIGLNDYAANNNPAAGIYVDEIYLVSPAMLTFDMFDLERVEVLKGPQGTLFGRNTTAGTVNFISRKPTEQLDASAQADFGDFEYKRFEGSVSGPLASGLTGRIAVSTIQQDCGYERNRLDGKTIGAIDRTSVRSLLEWKGSDTLEALLNLHGGHERSDSLLFRANTLAAPEGPPDPNPFVSGASIPPRLLLDDLGATLSANWKPADDLTLSSVSGWEKFRRTQVNDFDGSSLHQLDATVHNDITQYSQEVRLTYALKELLLTGGAIYSHDTIETIDSYAALDLIGEDGIGNSYRQRTRSEAAFVHGEYSFAPAWKLTTGVRWTDDNKIFDRATTFLVNKGVTTDAFPPPVNHFSGSNYSGKIGLDYKGFEHTLLYASVSRGFKSGGFQGQLTFNPNDLEPFGSETLSAYEIGAKSRLLDNTLQLNVSAFYYDYNDMQFYGGLFNSPVGVLFGIKNVGKARVQGAESDLWGRPARGLDIQFGGGLLDTKITKSIVDGIAEGSQLPNAPRFTLNHLIRYQMPLTGRLMGDVTLSGNYQHHLAFDIVRAPPQALEGGRYLLDARLGLSSHNGRWGAYLWGRNLTDHIYRTQVQLTSVGYASTYAPPRTYGVSGTFRY